MSNTKKSVGKCVWKCIKILKPTHYPSDKYHISNAIKFGGYNIVRNVCGVTTDSGMILVVQASSPPYKYLAGWKPALHASPHQTNRGYRFSFSFGLVTFADVDYFLLLTGRTGLP